MKIKINYTDFKKIGKYIFTIDNNKIIPIMIKNT